MTPILDLLCEIARKSRNANDVVKFDDMVWVATRIYDIEREIDALRRVEHAGAIEEVERVAKMLTTHMDVILEKCRGVAAMKARIAELVTENDELRELLTHHDRPGGDE
jgi:predicted transcriptional regulator